MADENKKGITVKIDADLHAQVKEYIEYRGMTIVLPPTASVWDRYCISHTPMRWQESS